MPSRVSACHAYQCRCRAVRFIAVPLLFPSPRCLAIAPRIIRRISDLIPCSAVFAVHAHPLQSCSDRSRTMPLQHIPVPVHSPAARSGACPSLSIPFPRFVLPSVAPSRSALPQLSGALPCHYLAFQSFAPASRFLALLILCPRITLRFYAFPWRVSASLIHGHAPLAELILRSVFPCYSFAMQCLSVPSRHISKLCRSISRPRPPNLRGPTPKQIKSMRFPRAPEERLTAPPESRT